ncbi:MAG: TIGR00701 family protein [Candidatus Pelagibacter sp. TMED64]|nr:TIGR00701 family protein [Candidatus Pelagibacter sp.]OUU65534.1 MAG: TIGR00701 family protein [Candidatus Pelagibacter sp. TMED64]|tara:strand:- start:16406 stop:16846 length:441 start_codon:yes stop_codon:yes gene_type:complete
MNSYLLFKSLHLIAVISWMAGLLYLPRIFVYHSDSKINFKSYQCIIFQQMEKRLMFYIMTPAMIFSWLFGILLLHTSNFEFFLTLWINIKLFLVIFLTLFHFFLIYCLNRFKNNENNFSAKFYRIINEVPTILLIIIVFIVVFKPL